MLGSVRSAMVLTARGVEQQIQGVDNVLAFINIALAIGAVGRPFSGYGTLTGQGNGQGGREHGQKADQLPGYRHISDPAARLHISSVWGITEAELPGPGKPAYELLDSAGRSGAVAPLGFYERLAELAERHDFVIASDEAYSELWFDEPPPSALQVADRARVIVFQTLSKRSSMTGYRSGFVAAPSEIVAALKAYRPTVGTAPQEFVQRASVVAWSDENHVEETRARYRAKREVLLPVLAAKGWEVVASRATMYLWVAIPSGESAEDVAARLLEHGLIVSPGTFFGPSGAGYVRFALVPTLEECERAAAILEEEL